jgi:hypothetical protein
MYVYTKYGEEKAKELGFNDRIAGEVAYCGKEPVSGQIAQAWLKSGYIEEAK